MTFQKQEGGFTGGILIHTKREARDVHEIAYKLLMKILIHTKREARDELESVLKTGDGLF